MNRQWMRATLRWLSPQEGGRRQLPQGPEYASTARFFGEESDSLFSVVIRFLNGESPALHHRSSVEIALLAPENLPQIVERMRQERELVITEGPRPVAECHVVATTVAI